MRYILFSIFIFGFLSCETKKEESTHLGSIELHASGSDDALPFFKEGMLLLHSFEYEDARAQFKNAQEKDSTMVMAYWGEAMTYNHPLWSSQYFDEANAALNKLDTVSQNRISLAKTPIEKDLMTAVEILYGSGEKADRDSLYCLHMKNIHQANPSSHEIGSLYALSLLGSVPARDEKVYGKAAQIVKGIIKENPQHPGALHYLIHSYDDPDHAHMAKMAADNYSKIAPDAGHALHMPSHIYIALGQWDDVISSNIASYEASVKRMTAKDLDHNARNLHALHWMMYAYLQKEMNEEANEALEQMKSFHAELQSPKIKSYMIRMQATYFAETGLWPEDKITDVDLTDLNITLKATQWFTQGMAAHQNGDKEKLAEIIAMISTEKGLKENELIRSGARMCSGVSRANQAATKEDIQKASTMELQLRALLAELESDINQKEKYLLAAAEIEDATPFVFGPPIVAKPSQELLAEYLKKAGRSKEAAEAYGKSLERAPGRRLSSI